MTACLVIIKKFFAVKLKWNGKKNTHFTISTSKKYTSNADYPIAGWLLVSVQLLVLIA